MSSRIQRPLPLSSGIDRQVSRTVFVVREGMQLQRQRDRLVARVFLRANGVRADVIERVLAGYAIQGPNRMALKDPRH